MLSTKDSKSSCSETCIFLRNKNQHDAGHHFYARINNECILEKEDKKKNKNKNKNKNIQKRTTVKNITFISVELSTRQYYAINFDSEHTLHGTHDFFYKR